MEIFATLWYAGSVVMVMETTSPDSCDVIKNMMLEDTTAAYEDNDTERHRVMRHVELFEGKEVSNTVWYAVHEVYYDDHDNVDGWTEEPAYPTYYPDEDDGQHNLLDDIARFAKACELPVLDYETGKEIPNGS